MDTHQTHHEHETMDHSTMDHSKMDHSKMDHSKMDHSKMDHSKMDHSEMDHSKMDHSMHDMSQPISMTGQDHHRMMIADFKKRFWISVAITAPVLILSPMIQLFFGYSLTFPGDKYIVFILSSVIFFYGGMPFLQGMISELKRKNPGMMTLIAMAIAVAYLY
ncbi:MAG: heavy metal translocating P-type ATPase, partial [Bacteroidota bacterium]|nr:heavy metal translocating P-type ATPase [Bacteroidota bacterium]